MAGKREKPGSSPTFRWVVTGANRGIGLAFARELVELGQEVIGTARKPSEAKELVASGARVETLDVSDDASVAKLARSLRGEPLDVLINNAAVGDGVDSIRDLDFQNLARFFEVNTAGPLRLVKALLPNLEQGRRRTIVSLSSGLGSISQNKGGWLEYRASKAALNMSTRTLAAELSSGKLIVIVLSPGWVRTDMGGAGATLTPQESVRAMLRVIEGLTPKDSGKCLDHRGREVAW